MWFVGGAGVGEGKTPATDASTGGGAGVAVPASSLRSQRKIDHRRIVVRTCRVVSCAALVTRF